MDKDSFWTWLVSEPGRAAVAGAAGGIVRWLTLHPSWKEGMATLVVGAICAIYAGPLALPIVEWSLGKVLPPSNMEGLSAFLVGIGGLSLSGFLLDLFELRRKKLNVDHGNGKG